jgi:DNA repair protein RecO (recombination protein O)
VLHRYDWSESSLIVDLFTRDLGRIAVAAKGAKRPYSQLRPVLLPFQRISVSVGKVSGDSGAGEVQNLRGAEWSGGAAMLTGAALFNGFYLNELLMKLLGRHDPHPSVFDAYAASLPFLGLAEDAKVQAALRAFELRLLKEIGVLPDLSLVTLTQQPLALDAHYAVLAEAGVVPSQPSHAGEPVDNGSNGQTFDGQALDGRTLIGLQAALQHGSLPALQQACAGSLQALKSLLRSLIQYHLGSAPLRTRQVMLGLQTL